MACTRYLDSIHELVDGTVGPIRRADLEAHLASCEDCRALAADLQKIRDAAPQLDDVAVPDGVWLQIAGRLRQAGRIEEQAPAVRARTMPRTLLALAAGLIIVIGASLALLVPRLTRGPAPASPPQATAPVQAGNAPTAESVQAVQSEVAQAQQQMETAIGHMEQIAKANQQALDPKTAATLEKNLGIIDQAIAETRSAVKADPGSVAANRTLFEALKQKVTLLQETIALMNEMRKGNNAGAAQIVEGMNRS
jgi:anti-sigma factor RsiW